MKKILLWHTALGLIFEVMLFTAMVVKNVNYTLALVVTFMVITSAGYVYFGAKEYNKKTLITALILLPLTFVTMYAINPIASELYEKNSLASLMLFPYGGAGPFIQFGVYLAIKRVYFGVILGKIALFIPSLLTLAGAWIGRIKSHKGNKTEE